MMPAAPIWEEAPNLRDSEPRQTDAPKPNGAARSLDLLLWSQMTEVHATDRLVRHLIGENSLPVMFGQPGCGKSFLSLDVALHVACGWPWFGLPVMKCGVVFIAAEGQRGIVKRIAAFRKRHGLDLDAEIPFAAIPAPIDLRSEHGDISSLVLAVAQARKMFDCAVGLIVIDTLSRTFGGGNENDSADMAAFVANIDRLRTETGAAVLIVHHAGKDDARGLRGHSILKAAADTVIEVSGQDGIRTLKIEKQKDGETGAARYFNLEVEEVGTDEEGQPITSCVVAPVSQAEGGKAQPKKTKLTPKDQKALDFLKDALADHGERISNRDISRDLPCPGVVVHVNHWRDILKKRGLHEGGETGKKWFQRVREALISANLIAFDNDLVWIVGGQK
jgi:KaiC/GvpD/RAD55 family RecA-like ATPase